MGYACLRAGRCLVYKDEKAQFVANNAAAAGKTASKKVPPPELALELRDAQLAWNPDPALSKRNYFIVRLVYDSLSLCLLTLCLLSEPRTRDFVLTHPHEFTHVLTTWLNVRGCKHF